MKAVLISFSELPVMQKYLYAAHESLSASGVDAWTIGSSNIRIARSLGPRNITLKTPESPRPSIASLQAARVQLAEAVNVISNVEPDVVHFANKHIWNLLLLRKLKSRGLRARYLHTFHDPIGHVGDRIRWGVVAYHRVIQRMLDGIITHSDIARDQVERYLRPRCPIYKAPLAVTEWPPLTTDVRSTRRLKHALIFGRLNRYKGCELFPSILREVFRLDPDVTITIAGKPSSDLPTGLLEEIRACPNVLLEDRYIEESEAEQMFKDASLVLTPYTSVTQSAVIIDAYSRALPVLAFDIEGIAEFTPDVARLVPAFDTVAFASALVDTVSSSDRCRELGIQAWNFGRDRFSPEVMVSKLRDAYESTTSSAHR